MTVVSAFKPWSVDRGLWTVDCGPWTVDCGLWSVDLTFTYFLLYN